MTQVEQRAVQGFFSFIHSICVHMDIFLLKVKRTQSNTVVNVNFVGFCCKNHNILFGDNRQSMMMHTQTLTINNNNEKKN